METQITPGSGAHRSAGTATRRREAPAAAATICWSVASSSSVPLFDPSLFDPVLMKSIPDSSRPAKCRPRLSSKVKYMVPTSTTSASPLTSNEQAQQAAAPLAEAIAIMARLRGPGGCPWDREQTFDSIKRHTLEETYEVFDAIERRDWPDLKDELGDLLLQVLFYAQMASEAGYFDIHDVAANLNAKLVRRHPHIFPPQDGPNAGRLAEAT